ncbi:MAG: hypothetical protein B7Z55_14935 [Planctomycetales bacterium 12-60-4]|nr:MAG: hypothetical protein B7Z55_14935 [Planctomycetales bacterium 12-60-4]
MERSRASQILVTGIWCLVSLTGISGLITYSYQGGETHSALKNWPAASPISRDDNRQTALVFLHPQCACSQAALAEICRLKAQLGERVSWVAILWLPAEAPDSWRDARNCRNVREMSELTIFEDLGGLETRRFRATTSGEVQLYSADGRLEFLGGVTSSRGHEGVNLGTLAIADWAVKGISPHSTCKVYGCGLGTP